MNQPEHIAILEQAQQAIAQRLGFNFQDLDLLRQGLTHASHCCAQQDASARLNEHNERLEFLGDAILGSVIADLLFLHYAQADEGQLSRAKSQLASRKTLARVWKQWELMPLAILGPQISSTPPTSVCANLLEGLIGAMFRDQGWAATYQAVQKLLAHEIQALGEEVACDAKNALQMWCLAHHQQLPGYTCQRCGGSDHAPRFCASAHILNSFAEAEGCSRRSAEQAAAALLLARLQGRAEDS